MYSSYDDFFLYAVPRRGTGEAENGKVACGEATCRKTLNSRFALKRRAGSTVMLLDDKRGINGRERRW